MPDTVAGLFRSRPEAELALRKLEEAGLGPDQVSLATPRIARRGHYGLKVLTGIVVGTLLGALAGAIVTGMVPGVKPLLPGNVMFTFVLAAVAGAATGGLAGGLLSMAASGDRALYYEQEGESGPVLVTGPRPRVPRAQAIMPAARALGAAPVQTARRQRPPPTGH